MSKKKRTYVEIEDLEDPIPAGGRIMKCPSCGAPVTSEICDECGVETGMHPVTGNMEYQQMECKAVGLDDRMILPPVIGMLLMYISACSLFKQIAQMREFGYGGADEKELMLIAVATAIGSVVSVAILARNLLRYFLVRTKGEAVHAKVCGYDFDAPRITEHSTKYVKLLAATSSGRKYIHYRMSQPQKFYSIGQSVQIMIYKDMVLIPKNQSGHR